MGDVPVSADVNLMGTPIPFSNAPFVLNGEIMVPARLFQEKIGALVSWNDSNDEMISYKDNIFLKLWQNNSQVQLNGKSIRTPVPVVFFKGELFAPAATLAQIYEMSFTSEPGRMDVAFREFQPETMQIGYDTFRKFSFPSLGISIYFPDYYELQREQGRHYLGNTFDPTHAEVYADSLPAEANAKEVVETRSAEIVASGGHIRSVATRKVGNFVCEVIHYETASGENAKEFLYLIRGMLYRIATFQMADSTSENIAATLSIDNFMLNEKLEHYMEFPGFQRYRVQFHQSLYSNMLVRNKLFLSGTVGSEIKADALVVTISKGDDRFEYALPITDLQFSGTVYVPFGIGKHNIAIYIRENEDDKDFASNSARTVLKFSVLNESSQNTADLVPTMFLDYDRNDIYNLLNRIGYTGINQYDTAKNLYQWTIDTYEVDTVPNTASPRSLSKIVLDPAVTKLKPIEICVVFGGLLRASGIPSRIVTYTALDGERPVISYYVEAFLNGKWFRMGVVEDAIGKTRESFMLPITPAPKTVR